MLTAPVTGKRYRITIAKSREFAPTWTSAETQSCVASVLTRAESAFRGEVSTIDGRTIDPRYRWHNGTLIERLKITPEEERQLATVIRPPEARRRDAERKRLARAQAHEAGLAMTRAVWLAGHEQKRASVVVLRATGKSWAVIASEVGYSTADAARMASK